MLLDGILNLSPWGLLGATLILTHITIASVTIYLHRHQAHRALDLHPLASHGFRFWLWLTTGMRTREWVAIHRKHHAKCETPDDPHSPQILGLRKVLWQGAELYRREAANAQTLEIYGRGTPDDWMERNVYRHSGLGLGLMFAADLVLFGLAGITIWALQMLWIPFWAAGVINGVGHYWGYRNYECRDAATNIVPWGILVGGEELHNNHHAYASSAKLSLKWWEFDIGWLYIRALAALRLAQVKRIAPRLIEGPQKPVVDLSTACAVVNTRLQVLARYSKEVLLPVCRTERRLMEFAKPGHLRRALVRHRALLKPRDRTALASALRLSAELRLVYAYRCRLQRIWERSTANHAQLTQALQVWCRQAENAGVALLEQFAHSLRAYAVSAPRPVV